MNHRHRKVLHQLFAHPINTNIHFRDVEALFDELGAETGHNASGRLHVTLNGHTANFHVANHGIAKDEVVQIRKFLAGCGIDPERDYPL